VDTTEGIGLNNVAPALYSARDKRLILRQGLRFFSDSARKKWPLRGQSRIRTFCSHHRFQFRVFGAEDRQDPLAIEWPLNDHRMTIE